MDIKTTTIQCPHCGHPVHVPVDYSNGDQDYYEDCANCCNPIHLGLHVDEQAHKIDLNVSSDDEQIY